LRTSYTEDFHWELNAANGIILSGLQPSDSVQQVVYSSGSFYPSATITTAFGCSNTANFGPLTVHPKPVAAFQWNPAEPTIDHADVDFVNLSVGAVDYAWDFGSLGNSALANPALRFPDTGRYTIVLIASNTHGCADTSIRQIIVRPDYRVFIASAFSPNGDGLNDEFAPFVAGISTLRFSIFNRWGEQLYSGDQHHPWDGSYMDKLCPQGVYMYTIDVLSYEGEMQKFYGSLTLLR
jgi:gliding motility-associated-like protein